MARAAARRPRLRAVRADRDRAAGGAAAGRARGADRRRPGLGRHAELVGELEALVAEHPLRERLRGQLMLALYRSARQAEALQAYRMARRELCGASSGSSRAGSSSGSSGRSSQQDPALDLSAGRRRRRPAAAPDRSLLVVPRRSTALDALLDLAEPLAARDAAARADRRVRRGGDRARRGDGGARRARATSCRAAASRRGSRRSRRPTPGDDIVAARRSQQDVDLLLMDAGALAAARARPACVLEQAPCDVALLVEAGGAPRAGPGARPVRRGASTTGRRSSSAPGSRARPARRCG